jgi:predicted site-specific integrase-resolvase
MRTQALNGTNEPAQAAQPADRDIISSSELLKKIPVSPRTLGNWRKRGLIPAIKLPGTSRVLFHWPSVQEALRRRQTAVAA